MLFLVFDLENRKDYNIHNWLNITSNTAVVSLALSTSLFPVPQGTFDLNRIVVRSQVMKPLHA
jgi:hypothetical protein